MSRGTSMREIAPNEENIPAGWPRPYYLQQDGGATGKPKYAQWSSETAAGQITACSSDRTWTAGAYNLCSSCGQGMERGLVFHREWMAQNLPDGWAEKVDSSTPPINLDHMDVHDTHYGSPLCYRCAVFALKHCPLFSLLSRVWGDDLVWLVVTRADQYVEFDETSAIEMVDAPTLEQVTTADVRHDVTSGRLYLLEVGADDLPVIPRPIDFEWEEGQLVGQPRSQPKFDPREVASGVSP